MKNTNLLLLFLLLTSNFLFAQEVHYFNKAITNSNRLNYSLSGFEVEDGFLILNYAFPLQGYPIHIELLKLDVLGNLEWKEFLGRVAFFPPTNAMVQDKENPDHFIVTYVEEENSTYPNPNIALLKCTVEGEILWKKNFADSSLNLRPIRLIHTNDGGYLIIGREGYSNTGAMLTIKVDSRGVQEWYHYLSYE